MRPPRSHSNPPAKGTWGGTTRMLVGHAYPSASPRWRPAPRPRTQHRLRCGPTRAKAGRLTNGQLTGRTLWLLTI
ncbi:hypothetical protein AV530_013957 [Patagioenas fasciata monilis]|uniref:Uncharacterized protein n=1 Tax=Patagioenas fasciata monilis TaxID=372326 RepID=A0A1V4J5J6_PATFA|nr:hypothetical protein AV530_013957 [Patagioenas fasciata monilis]